MKFREIKRFIFKKPTVKDAFIVSMVVGSILNIVNQGDILIKLEFEKLSILKLILTFAVPYLVSTYSSVRTRLSLKLEKK